MSANTKQAALFWVAVAGVMLSLAFVACAPAAPPTSQAPVVRATDPFVPTPLPPLPTVSSLGSAERPLVVSLTASSDNPGEVTALEQQLTDNSGLIVSVEIVADQNSSYEAFCSGDIHAILLDTFATISAVQEGCGEVLLVAEQSGSAGTQGQIVTSRGRGIFGVAALQGQDFCRPDPLSLSGWVVPSLELRAAGIDPFTEMGRIIDAGNDPAVLQLVLDQTCDVGATSLGAEVRAPGVADIDQIVVLTELPFVPNDALLVSTRLSTEAGAPLRDALRLQAPVLASTIGVDGFVDSAEVDYTALTALVDTSGLDVVTMAE